MSAAATDDVRCHRCQRVSASASRASAMIGPSTLAAITPGGMIAAASVGPTTAAGAIGAPAKVARASVNPELASDAAKVSRKAGAVAAVSMAAAAAPARSLVRLAVTTRTTEDASRRCARRAEPNASVILSTRVVQSAHTVATAACTAADTAATADGESEPLIIEDAGKPVMSSLSVGVAETGGALCAAALEDDASGDAGSAGGEPSSVASGARGERSGDSVCAAGVALRGIIDAEANGASEKAVSPLLISPLLLSLFVVPGCCPLPPLPLLRIVDAVAVALAVELAVRESCAPVGRDDADASADSDGEPVVEDDANDGAATDVVADGESVPAGGALR